VPGRPCVSTNTDADGKTRSPRECTFPPHGLGRGRTGRDNPPSVSKWRRWSPASHTPRWAGKTHKTEEAPAGDGKESAIACSVVLPLTYQGIVREAARGTIGCSVYFSLSIRYSCPGRGRREDHLESTSPAEPIGGNGSDGKALARPRAALPPHARQYDSYSLGTLSEVSRYFLRGDGRQSPGQHRQHEQPPDQAPPPAEPTGDGVHLLFEGIETSLQVLHDGSSSGTGIGAGGRHGVCRRRPYQGRYRRGCSGVGDRCQSRRFSTSTSRLNSPLV
jgi:hypothetical protein